MILSINTPFLESSRVVLESRSVGFGPGKYAFGVEVNNPQDAYLNYPNSSMPYTKRVANDMCSGANSRGMLSVYIPISSTSLNRSL